MRKKRSVRQRMVKAANVVLMALTFALAWMLLYDEPTRAATPMQTKVLLLLVCSAAYVVIGRIYEAFLLDVDRIHHMVYSQMLAAAITDAVGFIVLWMLMGSCPKLLCWLLVLPLQLAVATLWGVAAHRWYFRHFPPRQALIVTNNPQEACRMAEIEGFSKRFRIVNVLSTKQMLRLPKGELERIEAVFLLEAENAWAVMQHCALNGIRVYRVPQTSEIIASCSTRVMLFNTPMLRMDGYNPERIYIAVKRCMDLVLVRCALPLALPVMLVVAAAIKLEDGGPVFYRQERLTQGGRHFFILKFRSMCVNAESDGVARLSTGVHDGRITRVGRVIRMLRLDELPQLLNILKGDMSIVGPRPERPELAEEYTKRFPEFQLRLLAKAGLTGYAQVYGKYNSTPEEKLHMDLMYILRPSVLEDLRIMMATLKILFLRESTEGVAEGQISAMKTDMPDRSKAE